MDLDYFTIAVTEIDHMWLEGIGIGGSLDIADIGEICEDSTPDGGVCEKAQLSFNINLVAIRAESPLS